MRRAHDFLTNFHVAGELTTGEVHLRHHISPSGGYRQESHKGYRQGVEDWAGNSPSWELACLFFESSSRMTVTVAIDRMGGDFGPAWLPCVRRETSWKINTDVLIPVGISEKISLFLRDQSIVNNSTQDKM
ncbi:MAG: 50S ribosomal protein L32 [Propionivibrio sp.]|nr:50S ribosomal protein L32 [Propionivibrio sp.]